MPLSNMVCFMHVGDRELSLRFGKKGLIFSFSARSSHNDDSSGRKKTTTTSRSMNKQFTKVRTRRERGRERKKKPTDPKLILTQYVSY